MRWDLRGGPGRYPGWPGRCVDVRQANPATVRHRLLRLVRDTGDATIAMRIGVPRSTVAGWLRRPLPVVTTATNGGAEVLSAASGSVLERADDPDEIAAALVHWTDPARLAAARQAARAAALEHPRERTALESTAVIEACAARIR